MMTRKEMLTDIMNLAVTAERSDIINFITQELEAIEIAENKVTAAKAAKETERNQLLADILEVLPDGIEVRAKEVAEQLGISTQKTVYYLGLLVKEGKVVKNKEEKITTFKIVK